MMAGHRPVVSYIDLRRCCPVSGLWARPSLNAAPIEKSSLLRQFNGDRSLRAGAGIYGNILMRNRE